MVLGHTWVRIPNEVQQYDDYVKGRRECIKKYSIEIIIILCNRHQYEVGYD